MAVQIIPEQGVGESLGAGLGAGLQGLAQLKTQDLMRRQQAQYNVPMLQGLFPGVSNQQLQQLAMSDPSLINQLLRRQYETQQGAQLASIIGDPRLARLNPSQISAYMSSPEYAKSRAMKEASGTIGDIKKSIEGNISGGKFSGFISGLMGGKKSSYDALVSQLATSNDPLIKSLAAGLGAAPDDKTRKTIFNTFVSNNPESMPQVGQSIDNIHNNLQRINSTINNINNTLLECIEMLKDASKKLGITEKEIPQLPLDIYQCILLQSEPSDYKNLFLTSRKFKPKDNVLIILKQRKVLIKKYLI